jgi:hypothetical protein
MYGSAIVALVVSSVCRSVAIITQTVMSKRRVPEIGAADAGAIVMAKSSQAAGC